MIIHYEELQLVGWKKEVLITISEGCIETLKVSMWLCHENPIGLRFNTKKDVIGQLVHLKHVRILSFDYTSHAELQFYGEIRPSTPQEHILLILIASGSNYSRFKRQNIPFPVHEVMSVKPSDNQTCNLYPCDSTDVLLMQKLSGILFTFHHCISKNITFSEERNPFQQFINHYLQQEPSLHWYRRRSSARWIRSYEQQEDYFNKLQVSEATKL